MSGAERVIRTSESGPVGPLGIVLALCLLLAGQGHAATIHMISAGPVSIAGDLVLLRPDIGGQSNPVSPAPDDGTMRSQAATIAKVARCIVTGGTTLTTLGGGTSARAVLGQCFAVSGRRLAGRAGTIPLLYAGWSPPATITFPRVPPVSRGGTVPSTPNIRPPLPLMAPVPIPASAIALLTALALLYRFRRKGD